MRRIFLLCLTLLLSLTPTIGNTAPIKYATEPSSINALPTSTVETTKWVKNFAGSLGNNLNIHMKLQKTGNQIVGLYYYDKIGENIYLRGTLENNGVLVLTETDNQGLKEIFKGAFITPYKTAEETWTAKNQGLKEIFKGVFITPYKTAEGTWTAKNGKKELKFVLNEILTIQGVWSNSLADLWLFQQGNKIIGYHGAVRSDGMKVDACYPPTKEDIYPDESNQPSIEGVLSGSIIRAKVKNCYAGEGDAAEVKIEIRGNRLYWRTIKDFEKENYLPATMHLVLTENAFLAQQKMNVEKEFQDAKDRKEAQIQKDLELEY